MKKTILVLLIFVSSSLTCYSAPSASSVSGSSISGSSFGSKTTAAPIKWETFEENGYDDDWTFELAQNNYLSIETTHNRGISSYYAEFDIYNASAANFSWIDGEAEIQTIYVNYWINKDFAWGQDGNTAYGKTKWNRFLTEADSPTPNYYYEYNPYETDQFVRIAEYTGEPNTYHNYAESNLPSDTWINVETIYYISNNDDASMELIINGDSVALETDLSLAGVSAKGFGIGIARVRETGRQTSDRVRYDDIYIDSTRARVMIGDNQTLANSTHREIQIPTAWSDTEISVTWNQGSFNDYETAYLFVIDSDGTASTGLEGYFENGTFYTGSANRASLTGQITLGGNVCIK